ncbi:MAG: alpha-amylase family protein [Verrucomicrobiota bacterium]
MKKTSMIDRQVHLDFHTSEAIESIGSRFDEEQFIEALKIGHVGTINLFGVCHHGWAYYDSKLGYKHPHLETNLLERQMAACEKAGVRTVVYNTVRWNSRVARMHPEWTVREKDGSSCRSLPHPDSRLPMYYWNTLCLNSPYIEEYVLPSTKEIMTDLKPSGIFMDITFASTCYCDFCKDKARSLGLDPESDADMETLANLSKKDYREKVAKLVWAIDPKTTLFHNDKQVRREYEADAFRSHAEIESLPTGDWGYDHFPCNAAYFTEVKDTEVIGMTGKFHTSWGEFGGFKHPNALRWEVAQISSYGCLTCIGHHLHPTGEVDMDTFRLIGDSYKKLEENEPWLSSSESVAEVAILATADLLTHSETGACKMLLESQVPFAVVDPEMDWSSFRLLILPDELALSSDLAEALRAFQDGGGKILASGFSGLDSERKDFLIDLGVSFEGQSPWDVEYVEALDEGLLESGIKDPFLVYDSGAVVSASGGSALARTWQPYFNRTAGHFCGHREAPYEKPSGSASVVLAENSGYISQQIFKSYNQWGTRLYRELAMGLLERLLTDPILKVGLPSVGRANLRFQSELKRHVLHLLYATPVQRGEVGVIEDVVPIYDIPVSIRLDQAPRSVRLVPEKVSLDFEYSEGYVRFAVPRLELSQLVEIASE